MSNITWTWHKSGPGLLIDFGDGKTAFLQGEEACKLYDELDECPREEIQQALLSDYSVIAE